MRARLERGGLVQWRGLMRAVGARPHGPVATWLERVLTAVAAEAKLHRAGDPAFEGGVDSVTWSMRRAYLRDARDRPAEQR